MEIAERDRYNRPHEVSSKGVSSVEDATNMGHSKSLNAPCKKNSVFTLQKE